MTKTSLMLSVIMRISTISLLLLFYSCIAAAADLSSRGDQPLSKIDENVINDIFANVNPSDTEYNSKTQQVG